MWTVGAVVLVWTRGNLDAARGLAILALGVCAAVFSIAWVDASADAQVTALHARGGGWGLAVFPWGLFVLFLLAAGLVAFPADWRLGLLLVTFALLPVSVWLVPLLVASTRHRYLCFVHDTLARRLAALDAAPTLTPSDPTGRRSHRLPVRATSTGPPRARP